MYRIFMPKVDPGVKSHFDYFHSKMYIYTVSSTVTV